MNILCLPFSIRLFTLYFCVDRGDWRGLRLGRRTFL